MTMKVLVLVLNYNGWKDTIECLESVLRSDYPDYQVIVIDNNSTDGSLEHIKQWADGKIEVDENRQLKKLSFPPVAKPILYVNYTREQAELGGNVELEEKLKCQVCRDGINTAQMPLVFIQTGKNLGFAGGNNAGIRYAYARGGFDYVWLVNNDTVVEKNSLSNLVKKAYQCKDEKIGLLGSKLLYYNKPTFIQAIGGRYNKIIARSRNIGVYEQDTGQYDNDEIKLDYVIGASMLASKAFLDDVGLLEEDYFLYFEEVDWATRGKKKGWEIKYCHNSRVYHKDGASIGMDSTGFKKNNFADYLSLRNRVVFTKKHYPCFLLFVYMSLFLCAINRMRPGRCSQIRNVLKVIFLRF